MRHASVHRLAVAVALAACACGSADAGATDGAVGGPDAGVDAADGAAPDAIADAAPDAIADAAIGADAGADGPDAAAPDAGGGAIGAWEVAPGKACSAPTACADFGAFGGYHVAAIGPCEGTNAIGQLWFAGGHGRPAAGTYAVKPATKQADVLDLEDGLVALALTWFDASQIEHDVWAQSGTVDVAAWGAGGFRATFHGVGGLDGATAVLVDGAFACE